MIIYGEYLFLENFIAGYWIIRVTGRLCGRRPPVARCVAGSALCGIFAFVIFADIPHAAGLMADAAFALVIAAAVFRPAGIAAAVRIGAVFFAASFLAGGAAMAFMFAAGECGTVCGGILYIGRSVYIWMAAGAAAGGILGGALCRFVRERAARCTELAEVTAYVAGRRFVCKGKIDTGNYLREPLAGRPVSLAACSLAAEMLAEMTETELAARVLAVPYSSVGCSSGLLAALRIDRLTVKYETAAGSRTAETKDAVIGLYEGEFSGGEDEESYRMLLNPETAACEGDYSYEKNIVRIAQIIHKPVA